jgi:hypothetical protein
MSWAHGFDSSGRAVGYAIEATCDEEGCDAEIDLGLAYRCGGAAQLNGGPGCGGYYCSAHRAFYCVRCQSSMLDEDP